MGEQIAASPSMDEGRPPSSSLTCGSDANGRATPLERCRLGLVASFLAGAVILGAVSYNRRDAPTLTSPRGLRRLNATLRHLDEDRGPLYFQSHKDSFAEVVRDCVKDKDCRIVLNHVQKTGGTSIEQIMFAAFPPKSPKVWNTCCNDYLFDTVQDNLHAYCLPKFASFQLTGPQFEEVLDKCMKLNRKRRENARAVVITSIREPIQRAESQIHQVCNKNRQWRSDKILKACRRCSYEKDEEFWMEFTNGYLNEALNTAKHVTDLRMKNVRHLLVDILDLKDMFKKLREKLAPLGVHMSEPKHKNNENKDTCDFLMSSSMMKALKPSVMIYRALTTRG